MTVYGEMFNHYKEVHERLKHPSNAVPDPGINLKKQLIPLEPEPKKVLEPPPPVVIHMLFHIRYTKPSLGLVEKAVLRHFGMKASEIHGHRRTKDLVYPRQIFYYLARTLSCHSFPHIARRGCEFRKLLAKRDHTTVMHGYRKIFRLIHEENAQVIEDVTTISESLKWVIETPTTDSDVQCETPTTNSEVANLTKL